MGYVVDFLGVIYFHRFKKSGGTVLLPDGRHPFPKIAPHFASFFIEQRRVKSADWWKAEPKEELEDIKVIEFPIPQPSQLAITSVEPVAEKPGCLSFGGVDGLDIGGHAGNLPEITRIDNRLKIDADKANVIAKLPIHRGKLEARLFGKAAMTRLTVAEDVDLVVITARTNDGKETKVLALENGTEIVLSNTSDLLTKQYAENDTHFKLYGKLDIEQRYEKLKEPPLKKLKRLGSSHPYLLLLDESGSTPDPGCSNGCC
jgi:hypothetical protein